MLANEDIICISSIDWDFIWQGHQEIMSAFARNGNRVLFIENTGIRIPTLKDIPRIRKRFVNWFQGVRGFREISKNLYVYSPLVVPFQYSQWAKFFNRYLMLAPLSRWLSVMEFNQPIIWTFLPTELALDIIHSVRKKLLIYYYIADFDQLVKNPRKLKQSEERIMKTTDLIFVQGEDFKKKSLMFNNNVFVFPFGVNTGVFEKIRIQKNSFIPKELEDLPRPIIGYVGGVHKHIDFDLIQRIASTFSQGSLVMVGPIQTDIQAIRTFANIHLTGKKEFSELPFYIRQFDICLVPYLVTEYTKTVYPTKINEYHAMGKPVVSTTLPEVSRLNSDNLIYMARTSDEFIEKIYEALQDKNSKQIESRIISTRSHCWSSRIEAMSLHIEEAMYRKNKNKEVKWHERFKGIYRQSHWKILKSLCTICLLWGMIFYTPLMWQLASPLKKISKLRVSDAIVIFAGGVGESGIAGQGYEERVHHAVALFEQGYAPTLLFSSGARGSFFETYIMKTLAVSLGVPETAIILEEKAASTYENVKFSIHLLDKKGWEQIILVSSPYHMLRASLVFKKIAPEKKIMYAPTPISRFYRYDERRKKRRIFGRQINLTQIKAFLHEYFAIAYYWYKGYI